jgi:carbonyl reductase 1
MVTRGSVIAAASSLAAKYGGGGGGSDDILYALVNNAAIGFGNALSETLNTNFYGPKRVSDAFIPLIDRTVGRVVNLGSGSAPMYITQLDPSKRKLFADPTATWSDLEERIKEVAASDEEGVNYYYGFSKALLNSYTVQLSQAHPHLCINSCTPGFILTDLTRAFGAVNPPETGDL